MTSMHTYQDVPPDFFDFAYAPIRTIVEQLSELAEREVWRSGGPWQVDYIKEVYGRIADVCMRTDVDDEVKADFLVFDECGAIFDTGLYTNSMKAIYAVFSKNKRERLKNGGEAQPYYLRGFYTGESNQVQRFFRVPKPVRFYENLTDLLFDPTFEVKDPHLDHMLYDEEHLNRLPDSLRQAPQHDRELVLQGAIAEALELASANPRRAIPGHHKNGIGLFLPLYLTNRRVPDLVLVLRRQGDSYQIPTCLTIRMAQQRARVVARPEVSWLFPVGSIGGTEEKGEPACAQVTDSPDVARMRTASSESSQMSPASDVVANTSMGTDTVGSVEEVASHSVMETRPHAIVPKLLAGARAVGILALGIASAAVGYQAFRHTRRRR